MHFQGPLFCLTSLYAISFHRAIISPFTWSLQNGPLKGQYSLLLLLTSPYQGSGLFSVLVLPFPVFLTFLLLSSFPQLASTSTLKVERQEVSLKHWYVLLHSVIPEDSNLHSPNVYENHQLIHGPEQISHENCSYTWELLSPSLEVDTVAT